MRNVKCPKALTSFTHKDFTKTLLHKLTENKLDEHSITIILEAYDEYESHRKNLEQLTPVEFEKKYQRSSGITFMVI